jgi:hypothetical protein
MAEARSAAAIAQRLVITERAVAKHTASIFLRLGLQPSHDDNRRFWPFWPISAADAHPYWPIPLPSNLSDHLLVRSLTSIPNYG